MRAVLDRFFDGEAFRSGMSPDATSDGSPTRVDVRPPPISGSYLPIQQGTFLNYQRCPLVGRCYRCGAEKAEVSELNALVERLPPIKVQIASVSGHRSPVRVGDGRAA